MAELLPEHPEFLWDNPRLKSSYDVVIVGAGGHGLATAYYLAKEHGITNVAVIDKGWLGGGNMARNTTIIRSNYMLDKSTRFFDRSLQMWEGLDQELEYDFLFSQRGLITLAHTEAEVRESIRRVESNNLNGADADWLTPQEVKELLPIVNISDDIRHPVMGATHQPRAAIAKHDHVAWAYARKAAAMGVDIIQDTEVTGFMKRGDQVIGVETSRGNIATEKVGIAVAGHSSLVAEKAGFQVPIQSRTLQALVSELFEPVHPTILTSHHIHVYVSQAHKGELVMGANTDPYTAYGARGGFHTIQRQLAAAVELVPIFARAHLIRVWGGVVDISPDSTPIIGKTPVDGIYINCGWGSGGFKGVPIGGYTLAHTIAHDAPHELNEDFGLERYFTGHLVDEHSASGVLH